MVVLPLTERDSEPMAMGGIQVQRLMYVTANVYFQELCTIEDTLNDMCNSHDIITSTMGINMKSKYEKYWSSTDRFNLMIYVAFVLDPRYKMIAMKFWLNQCRISAKGMSWRIG